nr:MAG TPA: hypothetical protein [Caudoviricetes sp.]
MHHRLVVFRNQQETQSLEWVIKVHQTPAISRSNDHHFSKRARI